MNSMQYSDNICEAIDIIAKNVVKGLNFDQTILCTITDDSQAKKGEYLVTDGSSIYNVISNNHTYKAGMQVYVLIPKGDYSQQKIIVSEYSVEREEDEDNKGYIKPVDTIISVEEIYSSNENKEWGLVANSTGVSNQGSAIIILENTNLTLGPQYTRLSVESSFKTDFNKDIISGDYGLVLFLTGELTTGEKVEKRQYLFNCDRFFGNPYRFDATVSQSIVFDISDFKELTSIGIQFQESGNFYTEENRFLNYELEKLENLFVKNIKLILGFGIEEYQNNDLILTSKDSLEYNNKVEKKLRLNWIRERNNNTISSINSLEDININNYKYLTALKDKGYLSVYWYKHMGASGQGNQDPYTKDYFYSIDKYYNNSIYHDLKSGTEITTTNPFEFTFETDINDKIFERIKSATVITGCLRKKSLKTQFVEIDNGSIIEATVLKRKERPFYILEDDWNNNIPLEQKFELDYNYIYYDPLDEIDVNILKNSIITSGVPQYYWDEENKKYQLIGDLVPKEDVEWVRQYEQKELSTKTRYPSEEVEINRDSNKNVIYNEVSLFVYLSDIEKLHLEEKKAYYIENISIGNNEYYQLVGQEEENSQSVSAYQLKLVPTAFLLSNPVTFENSFTKAIDLGNVNLIDKLELDCLDELKGKYFIYREDNTIPMSVANNPQRYIQATFNSINSKDVISTEVEVQWKIPAARTMIADPLPDTSYSWSVEGSEKSGIINWELNSTKDFWISNKIILDGTEGSKDKDEGIYSISIKIPYQINSYYSPSLVNNTIYCIVNKPVKDKIPIENKLGYELRFGPAGMNGTNYAFILNLGPAYEKLEIDNIKASSVLGKAELGSSVLNVNGYFYNIKDSQRRSFIKRSDTDTYISVEPSLYNGKNLLLDLDPSEISWSWYNSSNKYTSFNSTIDFINVDNQCYLKSTYDKDNNPYEAEKHCAILQADIIYNNIKLTAYLPIPMAFDEKVSGVELTDKIIYNSDGVNPTYYKNPSKIFDQNNEEIENISNIIFVNRKRLDNKDNNGQYPLFKTEMSCAITVPPIYYKNQEKDLVSIFLADNNQILFVQPILIIQNRFGNAMLNEWDGNLIIDKDNNRILSAQVAAGEKNSDNSFSGILMGAVGKNSLDDSTTKYGLYGYAKGALSFGFKEDGTAFIGSSGSGRIEFNGNQGLIQSSNYMANEIGMSINLSTGELISNNKGGQVLINSNNPQALFKILDGQKNILINIGENNYYLQSSNYTKLNQGFRLDLNSDGFKLINKISNYDLNNAEIILTNENSSYFKISKKRRLMATNKSFTWRTNQYDIDVYMHTDGKKIILRNCEKNLFFLIYFNDSEEKTTEDRIIPNELKPFAEKVEKLGDNKYKYRILGELALERLGQYMKAHETIKFGGEWSYDSKNDIINWQSGSDKAEYHLAYWADNIFNTSKYLNALYSGHMNCLAYHKKSNTFFSALGDYPEPKDYFVVGAYNYLLSDNKDYYRAKYCELYESDKKTLMSSTSNNMIWQIAINSEEDILYTVQGHNIFQFKIPEDFNIANKESKIYQDGSTLKLNKFYNASDLYKSQKNCDRTYFTYQGMAADDKYFYFPIVKTSDTIDDKGVVVGGSRELELDTQYIDIRIKTNPNTQPKILKGYEFQGGTFVKIANCPAQYELEDIDFTSTHMYLSFSNIGDGGYITKIYSIPFNNNNLHGEIDLQKNSDTIQVLSICSPGDVINRTEDSNPSGTKEGVNLSSYKYSQGFAIGYDSDGHMYFANGVIDTVSEKSQQLLIYNQSTSNFKVKENEDIRLINIESNNFYLQSQDYIKNKRGTSLNLKTGELYATNATLTGTITGSTIIGSTITGGIITGSTIQTGGTNSNIILSTGGVIQFQYNNNSYGEFTTTLSESEKFLTLLGKFNGICNGITFGWDKNNTPSIRLLKDSIQLYGIINFLSTSEEQQNQVIKYNNYTFLDFSGGKITFGVEINSSTTLPLYFRSGQNIYFSKENQLFIESYSNSIFLKFYDKTNKEEGIYFGLDTKPLRLFGTSVYINNLVQSTEAATGSDKNFKHSIAPLTNNQEKFFLSLKPVNYKYNYGTSDRYHCGFIAQDVLKAIEDNNLTTQDIAAYVEEKSDKTPDGLSRGLRYGEFVALNTHMIQKCLRRIDELEIEVSNLKAQLI